MKRLALALIASILPLAAQTSSLQGTVTDAQGAVIPAAIVTATNEDTSASRMALTDEKGSYSFLQMQPGNYKVDVQKPGFNVFNAEARLQINTPSTLDVQLQVGQAVESVSVTAEITSINTENASIGSPFMEVQIKQLPLQTRNVVELLSLQPGVAPTGEVLGAKRDQNNVTLDGVDVNDNQNSGITTSTSSGFNAGVPVPLDSVQEFRTTVAGQGADQGRSSGGQVSLVTKGGSNAFHGSLYEYNRNTLMAANNWFSNRAGIGRQPLVRNQYGASLGGRLIRDRAFFFFNWEDRKDRSATAVTRTVPTESFKQGIVKVQMANGQVVSLAPTDVASVDPLHLGASSTMLDYLKQYPAGNDPLSSPDKGLNFSTLRFNAPQTLNNRAYVSRLDFNLDRNGRHSLMLRGSLNSAAQDLSTALAQFPGQDAVQRQVDNSRGLAARYTAVLSPSVVNVFSYGYTRIGLATTGSSLVAPTFFTTPLLPTGNNVRPSDRIAPTTNLVNDTTWTKGRHTMQFGMNLRFIQNDRTAYNNLPNYSFSRNTLKGLGADITASVLSYIQQTTGTSSNLQSGTNVTNAMGTLLGLINQYGATYNFDATGTAIPFGNPVVRAFTNHESEFYLQDSFHWKPNLTLTYGLRYSLFGVPYESNGVQVVPETPLSQYFADRVGGQEAGIPGYALPTAKITYNLGGPVNGGPGWYPLDKNNFAPRFALAWSPDDKTMAGKIMGKGSVIRAGAGVVYDRYGGNMTVSFANTGSPGLASTVSQPLNTNFTTAYRWDGANVPALPAAPSGGFPFTPPTVVGGFTSFTGISPDLKAPYSYLLNLTYARPLPKKMTLEIGYVGRLSHKGLLQQDFSQPLTQFKDPKSGMTWTQASGIIRALYDAGITPAQVKANPAILPQIPFFENMFAKAKDYQINGSATANYFYTVYQTYAGSDLDALNDMDRLRLPDGTCIAAPGCNTFFALQSAGLQSWVNAGKSAFHGLQVVLRRPFSNGWGYDFNYTWSHSIDNASGSESAGGLTNSGTIIQDAFNPNSFRGPSDFDIRHNITANVVGELPFGKGKAILGGAPKWLDQIVGGWQVSSLITYRTGTPLNIINGGVYPTNYLNAAIGILKPGTDMPAYGTYDQTGAPNLFANTSAVNAFEGQYPGLVGTRGILRGPSFFNVDLSVAKYINMPFEGQRIQLRGEAFNAFNTVNFGYSNANSSLSLATPATFGQYTQASAARVMQFALRYEF
jgi:hypothetical protein